MADQSAWSKETDTDPESGTVYSGNSIVRLSVSSIINKRLECRTGFRMT